MINDNRRNLHTSFSSIPVGIRSSVGLWGKVHDAHTSLNSPGTHEFTTWSSFLSTLPASIWTIYVRTVARKDDQGEPNGREERGWTSRLTKTRLLLLLYKQATINPLLYAPTTATPHKCSNALVQQQAAGHAGKNASTRNRGGRALGS